MKSVTVNQISNAAEREKAYQIRFRVFVEEQKVPKDLELDEYDEDPNTYHFLAVDNTGTPMGTARMRMYHPGIGKVERVAVLADVRGQGVGRKIMEQMEETAQQAGFSKLRLNAQMHAKAFYENMGYHAVGEPFDEAGIPHVSMYKTLV